MPLRNPLLLLLAFLIFACQPEGTDGWSQRNLMRYNIPLVIETPDSAKINTSEVSGIVRDVTIEDEEQNYAVQIFSGQAFTSDLARLKSSQLELVRENPYFERIVEEEPAGFIFETRIDSVSNYGFRYVVYQGDLEIVIQNGMGRIFDEASVRRMYEGVKQEE